MTDETIDEFEALLKQNSPIEPTVTASSVMFEAGRVQGVRQENARQAKAKRVWQLATACSLFLATGAVLSQLSTSTVPPQVVSVKQEGGQEDSQEAAQYAVPSETQKTAQSEAITPRSPTNVSGAGGYFTSAFTTTFAATLAITNAGDSYSNRGVSNRMILRNGVAGLPEPALTGIGFSRPRSNRQQLLEQLLNQAADN